MDNKDMETLKEYLGEEGQEMFLKCAECNNFDEIKKIRQRLDEGEQRFSSTDKRMNRFETALNENNKQTAEATELLKSMHDKMFIDTSDSKSIQSIILIASEKLTTLWSIVIFLIVSIAGMAFAVISGAMDHGDEKPSPVFYTMPTREQIHVETTQE